MVYDVIIKTKTCNVFDNVSKVLWYSLSFRHHTGYLSEEEGLLSRQHPLSFCRSIALLLEGLGQNSSYSSGRPFHRELAALNSHYVIPC